MITTLYLDEDLRSHYKTEEGSISLENLNKLNILIGENNSGKSRLLRALFSKRNFKINLSEFEAKRISKLFSAMYTELEKMLDKAEVEDVSSPKISGIKSSLRQFIVDLNEIEIINVNKVARDIINYYSWLEDFEVVGVASKPNIYRTSPRLDLLTNGFKVIFNKYRTTLDELIPETFDYKIEKVYIPILRGLRPTQYSKKKKFRENEDNYLKRTLRDYFSENDIKEEEIFTGLRLYEDTRKMLLGKREERDKIRRFEKF